MGVFPPPRPSSTAPSSRHPSLLERRELVLVDERSGKRVPSKDESTPELTGSGRSTSQGSASLRRRKPSRAGRRFDATTVVRVHTNLHGALLRRKEDHFPAM